MEPSVFSHAEEVLTHSTAWMDLRALRQDKESGPQETALRIRGVAACQHPALRAPADEGSEVDWTRAPPGRAAGISPDASAG